MIRSRLPIRALVVSVVVLVVALGGAALAVDAITVAGGNGTGSAANQFFYPEGFVVDGAGNIYVADGPNNRVQMFPAGSTSATNGTTVAGGNGSGSAANQLSNPRGGMAIDGAGNLYVSDSFNYRVQMFPAGSTSATDGTTVAGGNGYGSAANQLNGPAGLAFDGAGNLYVTDNGNSRVQMFPAGSTSATNGTTVAGGNGAGDAANQLSYPYGVALDGDGNIYVADSNNNRVQMFPAGSTSATNGTTVAGGNGIGSAANQLWYPPSLVVDGDGNLYVADGANGRVQMFPAGSTSATDGTTVAGGNGAGSAANQLQAPYGAMFDDAGNLYVLDKDNQRVQKVASPQDTDGDGIDDSEDNCPAVKNAAQADKDGDGVGNKCDDDLDGDLVLNEADNCPGRRNGHQTDKDGDGIGNKCDPDIDGDLIPNETDNCPYWRNGHQSDSDGDGIGNKCDDDWVKPKAA